MNGEERAVLLAARQKAITVLTASRDEASRIMGNAEVEAVELLLGQQRHAESLINEQTHEDGTDSKVDAKMLLESHLKAAELLAQEAELAADLRETTLSSAVDVLMSGQREAAAILLDSWMRVTEGHSSAGDKSS